MTEMVSFTPERLAFSIHWAERFYYGSETETYLSAEINIHEVAEIRSKFPFLKDMRTINQSFR